MNPGSTGDVVLLDSSSGRGNGRDRFRRGSLRGQRREQIEHHAVVLEDERRELKSANESVAVRMHHVLVGEHDVVLRSHVVRNVVVEDEPQEPVEQGAVLLLL